MQFEPFRQFVAEMKERATAAARKTGVQFGPFLAMGGLVGLMVGPDLVDVYSHHLL